MIEWHKPTRGRTSSATTYIAVSVGVQGKHLNPQLVVRFGPDAIKDLRLIAGDRVNIGLDKNSRELCFKRVSDSNGYKISNGKSASRTSLTVSATIHGLPLMSTTHVAKEAVTQEGAYVSIKFPQLFN